jgi:hypothetical protein
MPYDDFTRLASQVDEAMSRFSMAPALLRHLSNKDLGRLAEQASVSISLMEKLSPTIDAALRTPDFAGLLTSAPDLAALVSDSILQFAESERYLKDVGRMQKAIGDGFGSAVADHLAAFQRAAELLPDMATVLKAYSVPDMGWMQDLNRSVLSLSFGPLTRAYHAVRSSAILHELPAFNDFRVHDLDVQAQVRVLDYFAAPPRQRERNLADNESPIITHAEDLLGDISVRLQRRFVAARQALASNNPERTQHCAISLRRLILTLIDILGPNEMARAWALKMGKQNLFEKGKVTRRARLLYIVGWQGDDDSFSVFLERTVNCILANLDVLNAELHEEAQGDQMEVVLTNSRGVVVVTALAAGIETLITAARYRRDS